ncbi:helix-turn-helix transcriptional regulator [Butyrivibrio sp. INlla14]|uniref:helix-turn-helix transcriptional regulator n=1 Tax=Butyrivibrio sp. INlla14 TaxID=1520808 RepID=UPI000876374C|nr:helix-turn-helix transcriptional regulator [Butyrivibrio sp. INlla14]SCY45713.1 Transcriptional regulator, contains XRE-family HTH domain [Butyrivibrio sp. INlla14]
MADSPLAQYLRLLRDKYDYKQDDVAKYLGITRATYSHYETSRLMPPTEALYKLSIFYKIPLNKLIKLSIASSKGENQTLDAQVVLDTESDLQADFDGLYQDFLSECADMSAPQLKKWTSMEDLEMLYYYHQINSRDKRVINYLLRLMALNIK